MKLEKNKMIGFSFAFYNKANIKEYLFNEKGGLEDQHLRLLGQEAFDALLKFNSMDIEAQRKSL